MIFKNFNFNINNKHLGNEYHNDIKITVYFQIGADNGTRGSPSPPDSLAKNPKFNWHFFNARFSSHHNSLKIKIPRTSLGIFDFFGADNGTRTHNSRHGKAVL